MKGKMAKICDLLLQHGKDLIVKIKMQIKRGMNLACNRWQCLIHPQMLNVEDVSTHCCLIDVCLTCTYTCLVVHIHDYMVIDSLSRLLSMENI